MTAVMRSTSAYAPPLTQNTAPVYEFRCLYTRDLHKKVKKWHDGSLRFHTFNRRVMVYDDVKNYIGDLHYRQEENFDEGIELQLDRGVKVEVGERLGETQTDLAPILERRRAVDNGLEEQSPIRNTRTGGGPRHRIARSQRPKSLVEVLGASQSRPGHFNSDLCSPFEQRQSLLIDQQNGPPAKKQRVSTFQKDLNEQRFEPSPRHSNPVDDQGPRRKPNSLPPKSKKANIKRVLSVMTIPSDQEEEVLEPAVLPRQKRKMVERRVSTEPSNSVKSAQNTQIREDSRSNRRDSNIGMHQITKSIHKTQTVTNNEKKTKHCLKSGMTRLMLNPKKPPRKLIYTDLLPITRGSSRQRKNISYKIGRHSDLCQSSPDVGPKVDPSKSSQTMFETADGHDYALEIPKLHSAVRPWDPNTILLQPLETTMSINSSPLFIPTQRSHPSPTTSVFSVHEDFLVPAPNSDEGLSEPHERIQTAAHIIQQDGNIQHETYNPPPNHSNASVKSPIAQLQHPPNDMKNTTTTQAATFRRVFSENDAILSNDVHKPDAAEAANNTSTTRHALGETQPKGISNFSNRPLLKPSLERAASDPSTVSRIARKSNSLKSGSIINVNKDIHRICTHVDLDDEAAGPWSTTEAFLLFGDWWPPGREKPKIVEDLQKSLAAGKDQRQPNQFSNAGGGKAFAQITTAREVLEAM